MNTLNLFGAVPVTHEDAERMGEGRFLAEYGVVIDASAMSHAAAIEAWVVEDARTSDEVNATSFYRSWATAATISDRERMHDQIMHYLSTYGLKALGLDAPEWISLPEALIPNAAPERGTVRVRVIRGLPRRHLIQLGLEMLARPVAMKQATIEALIACLVSELDYKFTGEEHILNREAQVLVAERTGVLPATGEALLRYLVYRATGATLVIKNQRLIDQITASCYALPPLTDGQMVALAAAFYRMKAIWLAFRHAHASNRPVVNRVRRLAERYHQPVRSSVLASLTSTEFPAHVVLEAAQRATMAQLVRALNAVRLYQDGETARFYRVRNGRSYAKADTRARTGVPLAHYEGILRDVLAQRVAGVRVHMPPHVAYAFPVSAKRCVGAIPAGTRVHIPSTDRHILIGVYWENGDSSWVDLDLSAVGADGSKIGWNGAWRTDDRGLIYSGDVTNAPTGASEWIYGRTIDQPYLVVLNAFCAPDDHPFRVVVGYGQTDAHEAEAYKNYMIDPNHVLFSAPASCTQRQIVIGVLFPSPDGMTFMLSGQSAGNKTVSVEGGHEAIARTALCVQARTALALTDVIPVGEEGDGAIDLTGEVTIQQMLSLLDGNG